MYQYQTILKIYVLNFKIVKNLQCQAITLNSIQLYLSLIFLAFLITLASIKLDIKELDINNIEF